MRQVQGSTLVFCALTAVLSQQALANTPFTIVALPDTQNYVNNATNAPLFTQQTQWIADQVNGSNPRNIQFVTHLGDIVSEGNSITQWDRADTAMDVLDAANIPYGILPGNHDYNSTGNKSTGTENYVNYFGPSRFAGKSWYGGSDPSGVNHYQKFSAGGYNFIHLSLEWQPNVNIPFRDPSPIQWAQSILNANPNTPFIVSTHEHIDDDPPGRSGSGNAVWDQLIKNNDQIFMVLNGHYHSLSVASGNDGEYHQVSTNNAGRQVFEVLQDYQDYPRGGDGWLRLFNFDIPNNVIKVETYSPVLDQFQTETVAQVGNFASRFDLPIDFATRLVPVFIPPPPPPPQPDRVFRNGLNGYNGTQDTMIRSNETAAGSGQSGNGDSRGRSFGNVDFMSVDGDDGSPGSKPNQGLIRFDDIVGTGANQITPGTAIASAKLILEAFDPGSGFTVHEMLVNWDESSTWNSMGNGVQANDVEAATAIIATFGANTSSSSNVPTGTLEIDVTAYIQAIVNGTKTNLGWLLNPFPLGTNGVDIWSSEAADFGVRPRLEIMFVPEPASFALLAMGAGMMMLRRRGC